MGGIDWAVGSEVGIPATMGLACVALTGYIFGRRTRKAPAPNLAAVGPRELHRAARVACQLEETVDELRKQLAEHRAHVDRFKSKVNEATHTDSHGALGLLSSESELVIGPTLRLASRLSHAYDELRQQSQTLSNFTEGRTDPVTGLGNTPALEEQLELALDDRKTSGVAAAVALVSVEPPIDAPAGGEDHRTFVRRVAKEIERCVRENDYIARLGGTEFAILMPKTALGGARIFGTRLRQRIAHNLHLVAGCGLAEALPADSPSTLLSRADSALYSARATGGGVQYLHTGDGIHLDRPIPKDEPHVALDKQRPTSANIPMAYVDEMEEIIEAIAVEA